MAPPLKDSDAVFFKGFVQTEDPGEVGAGLFWVHPETGAIRVRNGQNTDWSPEPGAAPEPEVNRRRQDKGREPDRRKEDKGRPPERGRQPEPLLDRRKDDRGHEPNRRRVNRGRQPEPAKPR